MKPNWYLTFFLAALLLSLGISFIGYRYLALANSYREANFIHLNAVALSIDLIRRSPFPNEVELAELADHIELANAQASWCLDVLGPIDRFLFTQAGGGDALELCVDGVSSGQAALTALERLGAASGFQFDAPAALAGFSQRAGNDA